MEQSAKKFLHFKNVRKQKLGHNEYDQMPLSLTNLSNGNEIEEPNDQRIQQSYDGSKSFEQRLRELQEANDKLTQEKETYRTQLEHMKMELHRETCNRAESNKLHEQLKVDYKYTKTKNIELVNLANETDNLYKTNTNLQEELASISSDEFNFYLKLYKIVNDQIKNQDTEQEINNKEDLKILLISSFKKMIDNQQNLKGDLEKSFETQLDKIIQKAREINYTMLPDLQNDSKLDKVLGLLSHIKSNQEMGIDPKERCQIINPSRFYDTVIKASTFFKVLDESGWEIRKNMKNQIGIDGVDTIVVSILGNFGKGKSWILSYLSDRQLPFGHNIHTEGLSCIYPESLNIPITYMDSAGFDEPLQLTEYKRKCDTDSINTTQKTAEAEETDEESKMSTATLSVIKFLRDKQYMEHFIQQFLLETADVFLVAVSQMTFSDQRLINRIKNEYKGKKKIYIIHNFYNLQLIEDVKKYITKDIENSFDIREVIFSKVLGPINHKYYIEKDDPDIRHIIMAREGTEAGRYYNSSAKEIILTSIFDKSGQQKKFRLEDALLNFLSERVGYYIENASEYNPKITINDDSSDYLEISEQINETEKIVEEIKEDICLLNWGWLKMTSNGKQPIEYKRASVDEFGFLDFYLQSSKSIELPYNIYETENELVWETEMAGYSEEDFDSKFKVNHQIDSDGFYFRINGKKTETNHNKKEYIFKKIIYGDISFCTAKVKPITRLLGVENFDCPSVELNEGILSLKWIKKKKIIGFKFNISNKMT